MAEYVEHYKKGHLGKEAMGNLSFDIIKVQHISKDYLFVIGKWMIKRTDSDMSRHYSLLIKKIKGEWKIIADNNSS